MSIDGLRVVIQHPRDSFHVKPSSSPHVADPQVSSDHLNCNILAPTDFDIKISFADDPGLFDLISVLNASVDSIQLCSRSAAAAFVTEAPAGANSTISAIWH
jgi:hypothetical protein